MSRHARWICNAFSLNMIRGGYNLKIHVEEVTTQQARQLVIGAESSVGHEDTAKLFSLILERGIAFQRKTVELAEGEYILVGQYIGTRLPEFMEQRPKEADLRWLLISYSREDS